MARVVSKTRSTKQLKTSNNTPDKKRPTKIKKTKDGWEMTAHEALKVNFVVSEI